MCVTVYLVNVAEGLILTEKLFNEKAYLTCTLELGRVRIFVIFFVELEDVFQEICSLLINVNVGTDVIITSYRVVAASCVD